MPKKKENKFKLGDSYTSLMVGIIVVLIVGILFISFARGNRDMKTSSIKEELRTEQPKSQEKPSTAKTNDSKTSSTYTIKPGDDLWSISESVYKDGYKWVEIAKANKLEKPGLIHAGNKISISEISPDKNSASEKIAEKKDIISNPDKTVTPVVIFGDSYIVKTGDDLWNIALRAYGDGYKWTEIAKVNNLENPDLIFSGNILKIPR